jgi:putative two-component system response regulator
MNFESLVGARVLVVDDEVGVCSFLRAWLAMAECHVAVAHSVTEALALLEAPEAEFDAVLSDIRMPGGTGLDLLRSVKNRFPDVAFILMTAVGDLAASRQALRDGADDFLLKPFQIEDMGLSLQRGLDKKRHTEKQRSDQQRLERLVDARTSELNAAKRKIEKSLDAERRAHLESIIVLAKVAEKNDEDTGNHIRRVSRYCSLVSTALGLTWEESEEIAYSAPMHDIGKIAVDQNILQKRGRLTPDEFAAMKLHTIKGAEILEGVPFLSTARDVAIAHHERFDGAGYPYGLVGEAIPLSGRIVAAADVFDALTNKRCYKPAWTIEETLEYMGSERGKHFDPAVVDGLFLMEDGIRTVHRDLADDSPSDVIVPAGGTSMASIIRAS